MTVLCFFKDQIEIEDMVVEPFSNLSKCSMNSELDLVFQKMSELAKTMLENTKNYVRLFLRSNTKIVLAFSTYYQKKFTVLISITSSLVRSYKY